MVMFCTDTDIWRATIEGSLGVALSKSKAIRRKLAGSMAPNVESKAFRCFGNYFNTSRGDIAVGD